MCHRSSEDPLAQFAGTTVTFSDSMPYVHFNWMYAGVFPSGYYCGNKNGDIPYTINIVADCMSIYNFLRSFFFKSAQKDKHCFEETVYLM